MSLSPVGSEARPRRVLRRALGITTLGALLLVAAPSLADSYDQRASGHPLRIIAYALHPVGVVVDTLIFRPAHWVVHRADWLETLFGHDHD